MSLTEFLTKKKELLKANRLVFLQVKVKVNARETGFLELLLDNETVKIALNAPPLEGKANTELLKLVSKEFGVGREYVKIVKGAKSVIKVLKISS